MIFISLCFLLTSEEISGTEEILVAVAMGLFFLCFILYVSGNTGVYCTEAWVAVPPEQQKDAIGDCLLCCMNCKYLSMPVMPHSQCLH